jgi:DNA polymerase-1
MALDDCAKRFRVAAKLGDELYEKIGAFKEIEKPTRWNTMSHFWEMAGDDETVVDYATGDGVSTWQLNDALQKQYDKPYDKAGKRTLRNIYELELRLMPVLNRMTHRGIPVNKEKLEEVIARLQAERDEAQKDVGEVNARSSKQVHEYMLANGITEGWPLTEKKNPSFTEDFLMSNEPGRKLMLVRKRRTLLSTHLEPMLERIKNGRIYPHFNQTRDDNFGTKTGRLSANDPNFFAIPSKRQGDLGRLVRSAFVPEDGQIWVERDYSSAEVRIAAHYSKAQAWLQGFTKGLDPHQAVADEVGITRQHAKTTNLGIIMGMGIPGLSQSLKCEEPEARALLKQYYQGLPELRKFQKQAEGAFKARGYVTTIGGRRLHLSNPDKAFTATNRLTQGGNADIMKDRLAAMDEVDGINLHLSVYDSVSFSAENEKAANEAAEVMEDVKHFGLIVDMPTDVGFGRDWGEASFEENNLWPEG